MAHWLLAKHVLVVSLSNYVTSGRSTCLLQHNAPLLHTPTPRSLQHCKISHFKITANQLNTLVRQLYFLWHISAQYKIQCKITRYKYCLIHVLYWSVTNTVDRMHGIWILIFKIIVFWVTGLHNLTGWYQGFGQNIPLPSFDSQPRETQKASSKHS
jgi:hypothetical protein